MSRTSMHLWLPRDPGQTSFPALHGMHKQEGGKGAYYQQNKPQPQNTYAVKQQGKDYHHGIE